MSQPGESSISLGGIQDRAEKLEAAQKEEAAKSGAPVTPEVKPAEGEPQRGADGKFVAGKEPAAGEPAKPAAPAAQDQKQAVPNDPVELRKWNTKISMELSEMRKQQQALLDAFNKSTKKPIDWKTLAKDAEKLEKAVEEYNKQQLDDVTQRHNENTVQWVARYTKSENLRRLNDPAYPRWSELQPFIMNYAAKADSRIDFEKDPNEVLDAMYELAQKDAAADPNYKAPAAKPLSNPEAKYTEADLAAKIKEAVDKAVAEAQKGLKAEENGAGVGGMGKGAGKGSGSDSVKKAAWAMPLGDLKAAIQQATENLK